MGKIIPSCPSNFSSFELCSQTKGKMLQYRNPTINSNSPQVAGDDGRDCHLPLENFLLKASGQKQFLYKGRSQQRFRPPTHHNTCGTNHPTDALSCFTEKPAPILPLPWPSQGPTTKASRPTPDLGKEELNLLTLFLQQEKGLRLI
jgi:hypothetical protein